MRRTPLRRSTYRALRSDEPDPPGEPLVYATTDGRWMMRWKIAQREYVERVARNPDGSPVRSRPYKMRHVDFGRAAEMYQAGQSLPAIAAALRCDTGNLSRALRRAGVRMRSPGDYARPVDIEEIIRRYRGGEGYSGIALDLGVSPERIRGVLRDAGLVLRGVGMPPGRRQGPKAGPVSYQTEFRRMIPVIRRRSGERCEAAVSPHCRGRATHVHHRKLRKQGGKNDEATLLDLCVVCHLTVHGQPARSRAAGLLVPSWADPELIPVDLAAWHSWRESGVRSGA